jgi:carbamoyl-phosphate synthase large subunit
MPGMYGRSVLRSDRYIDDLLDCCHRLGVSAVVPGADATVHLVAAAADRLSAARVSCAINRADVIAVCSDKAATFARLAALGIPTPWTRALAGPPDVDGLPLPCVIKPATGTGGSSLVALAASRAEALAHAGAIWSSGRVALAQEYLPADGGEFTVGVLTLGDWVGSVAMRREFPSKLSYVARGRDFIISSGYSQGLIDDFPHVRMQAERIARLLGSRGPLNIQGRMRGDEFVPFEINPRVSASTHLRHLAGFPEIPMLVDFLLTGRAPDRQPEIRPGYYLRSLTETYVPRESVMAPA